MLPELSEDQVKEQAKVLQLSEKFPESSKELIAELGTKKFFLGTELPSIADLIVYGRVRSPIVESWKPEDYKVNRKQDESAQISLASLGGGSKKSAKKEKSGEAKPAKQSSKTAAPITPTMVDLRVGFIQKAIPHPDADSLYVSTIDMGDESGPRTVCSGLVKYIPLEEMQQRLIVVVANLKPVNMRGIKSEAMVLCASDEDHGKVEFTVPPEGSKAGDRLYFEGFEGTPEVVMNPKKKIFETLQPNFTTLEDLSVVFKAEDGSVRKLANREGKIVKAGTLVNANVR
ncbi:uncharacterized protein V1516DRAFT_162751 [Lipomyces oligophaga]|uniref:uncharacterized protein n=1 Tax=Lipomyces oligophaga TaxID=45792 RepID=UPI0034CEABE9